MVIIYEWFQIVFTELEIFPESHDEDNWWIQ
jgi:hypothetical protein